MKLGLNLIFHGLKVNFGWRDSEMDGSHAATKKLLLLQSSYSYGIYHPPLLGFGLVSSKHSLI